MSQPAVAGAKASNQKKSVARSLQDVFGLNPDTMTPAEKRSAISGYDLRYRIEAMVAGVSNKKIKHVYVGDGAATAPGIMFLPRIPGASLFPMRHVRILLGYAAHEIAHQLETNFQMLVDMIEDKSIPDVRKRQLKEFWNAIEDYRIEKLVRKEFPGFHSFIDDTRDHSARRFCENADNGCFSQKDLANPYRLGSVALTWLGADINGYKTRAPHDALSRLEPNHRAWIEGWRDEMAAVETCQDAFDLANRILDELDQMRGEDPEEQQQSQGDQGSPNQKGPSEPGQGGNGQKGEDESGPQGPSDEKGQNDPSDAQADNSPEENADESQPGDAAPDNSETNNSEPDNSEAGDPEAGDQSGKDSSNDQNDQEGNECGSDAAEANTDGEESANGADADQTQKMNDTNDGQEQEEGENVSSKSDSNSANGKAAGEASNDAESSSSQDGADSGEDATSSENSSQSTRPRLSIQDGDEQAEAEAADLEIEELIEAINSLIGEEAKNAEIMDEKEMSGEALETAEARVEKIRRGQGEYNQIRQEVGPSAARAAGALRRMLQSQDRRSWRGGKEEGDLDFGRVVPMVNGSQDVYRARTQQTAVNTAVSLLLDNSGSMSGNPLRMCQATGITLDMAVKGTRTNVEITGFTSASSGVKIYRYRAFGQKGGNAAASLGNMGEVQLGGTPVSTPLLEAWRRLSQQKEPRRIMIVVSDGGADGNDKKAAREAHDFIVSQGCIVIGIAIGSETLMKEWCDNVQAIESFEDLPVALTHLVREAMK